MSWALVRVRRLAAAGKSEQQQEVDVEELLGVCLRSKRCDGFKLGFAASSIGRSVAKGRGLQRVPLQQIKMAPPVSQRRSGQEHARLVQ
jgi:hypothetical protein